MRTRESAVRSLWTTTPIALEFLTPLRLRRVRQWDDDTFGRALGWYPAVGLLIGLALLALDLALEELLPPGPRSALLLAALALLSGGLHLDGVADTADGMALQGERGDRLSVMSEGSVGPAGAMALAIVLLVQWAALAALADPLRLAGLVLAPALARWTVAPVAALFRPARPRGLGHALQQGVWPLAAPLAALNRVRCVPRATGTGGALAAAGRGRRRAGPLRSGGAHARRRHRGHLRRGHRGRAGDHAARAGRRRIAGLARADVPLVRPGAPLDG